MDKLHAGIDEYLSGDLSKAVKLLQEHIQENGYDLGSAYYHLGLCYSDLNNMAKACKNFIKAVEYSPNKSMYLYKLGLAYYRLMALDKARDTLLKTINLNPEHQRSRFLLGQVYFQHGDMNDAENIFSEVLDKSPDFADAYYYRALTRYQLSKDKEALSDLHKAIEINPEYTDAILESAKIHFENGNFGDAASECKLIYNKGNRTFSFMKFYLTVLSKNSKNDELELLKAEAASLFPNNLEIDNI